MSQQPADLARLTELASRVRMAAKAFNEAARDADVAGLIVEAEAIAGRQFGSYGTFPILEVRVSKPF